MSNLIISVTLTSDSQITKLNKKYLNRDFTTDVLSFKIDEETPEGETFLGDVVVNTDQAKRQAKEYGNSYEQEVAELVEHGVLHLLDVHHDDDNEKTIHGIKLDK
ncbi:rRNA maturation RNase YbeY [candidate division WWE3 bacterium RBG_16_37_10]|uniref:Endoribonuclease YbeY n=1 Tax=candidate division WWE3 bacterium RBG_16_37_10 TaxID=1802610 RepID=A0A1F4UVK4_UNCKA|nr:MAG: rRNA maturation RNase YbeY [candidate division WWE3 bacterium RBG_16_37_10]